MEQLNFNKFVAKKETRYDLIEQTAKKLGKTTGQMLGLTRGISHQDLIKILQSVEALSRDKGLEFGRSFWWHLNGIKKPVNEVAEQFKQAAQIHGSSNPFELSEKQYRG